MGFAASSALHPFIAAAANAGDRAGQSGATTWGEDARDRALLERMRVGDIAAFEALVGFYAGKLTRFADSVTGSSDLGDEAAQDVLFTMWEQREALDVRGSVGGYLYRAVRNRALNIVRRERTQLRISQDEAVGRDESVSNGAGAALDAADLRAEVQEALARVPTRCREIFFLVWANELTYHEVADVLGVRIRTVQNQYYRAVAELVRYFGER